MIRLSVLKRILSIFLPLATLHFSAGAIITAPLSIESDAGTVAGIEGKNLRVRYVNAGAGGKALASVMECKADGKWIPFISPLEDNKVVVITGGAKLVKPTYKNFYPSWKGIGGDDCDPWLSGSLCEAVPVKAWNKDKNTIAVEYVTAGDHKVTGYWRIRPDGGSAEFTLEFTPSADGTYSLALMGAHAAPQGMVSNVLLPPMAQYGRIPEQRNMLLSAMMPQPLAIVETATTGTPMSAFVAADLDSFPLDWGGVDYSPVGFTLLNNDGLVQPVAFSPVLGMDDSLMKAGTCVTRRFITGVAPQSWNLTLEDISENIFEVRDYRHQPVRSLTESMFAITDLMTDNGSGGWDSAMRGFYDIEGKPTKAPTVVHSAPLAIVAAAINAGDEKMYVERALPTIEYTLSRKGFRWSTATTDEGYNKDPETLRFNPVGSQFPTSYYEGLDRLLGGRNAWLRDIALPGGELRVPRGYSVPILSWVQALHAYRMTGDSKWLRKATSTAERDAKMHIYTNSAKPMRYQAFYNSTMYAPWVNFIDLYEETSDPQWLDAARKGSAHTIAGIRSWPPVKDEMMTIHPGGVYNGNATMWWKGNEQYRLGFPRVEGDAPEHEVEQWTVSPVGLGFEQPSTYFLRAKGKKVRPVFMSNWAPALMRLGDHTGERIFGTYARNAVIGRFTNYPGYYATGYTDITMAEDFPYKGPDVSSIYYHHIPPHLAFTADFLVSEAIGRSKGKVDFPYGRQEGFVWFSNRVYGGAKGSVYGDKATLWMAKGLVESSNPEVNYVTAVSDSRLWILLSNESQNDEKTTLTLGKAFAGIADASQAKEHASKLKPMCDGDNMTLTIPAGGFAALSVPVDKSKAASLTPIKDMESIPVLADGYKSVESGTEAGKVHFFRIRSPFGWDSVYGYCETPPCEGVRVSVACAGEDREISSYPYEWSFSRFGYDEKVPLKVSVSDAKGAERTIEVEL